MATALRKVDLCVIGAGAAGLSVAAAAGLLGVSIVLIERGRMGGECLNTGCVPSKALLASARAAHDAASAHRLGIDATPRVDFDRVVEHVHGVIAAIAPHDSVEQMARYGVDVIRGAARFVAPRVIAVDDAEIHARRVVVATGSAPSLPPLPGLDAVPFLTNENVFDNRRVPSHLVVLGGGPLGIEMAQAYRRLGAAVTVVTRHAALPADDPEVARVLVEALVAEGIAICEHTVATRVERTASGVALTVVQAGSTRTIDGSHVLVAVGRTPRVSGLGLDAAGIAHDAKGIVVDDRLRTRARGVYAAGDVVDAPHFTHVCSHHAAVIIQNALLRLPVRVNYASLPRVTYSDPEIAQVGMTQEQALARFPEDVTVVRVPYADSDRAQSERRTQGLVKVIARSNGRVLGASLVGERAGETAGLYVLAIEFRLKLTHIAQMIAPYPTYGELARLSAIEFVKPRFTNGLMRRAVRLLSWLP